ncbi:hypothetical protein TNCV_1551651 [Trichonephila clavipes]|nr:hypothetical protein TNCV_1551651 [Trichonephila clavipes]
MIQITGSCLYPLPSLAEKQFSLLNGNILPSIPMRNFVHVMETYANVKLLLELIKYAEIIDSRTVVTLKTLLYSCECSYVTPSTAVFCVGETAEIKNRTTYKTYVRPEIEK